MIYEIVMPQLSDSMDEGKLISWKVSEGESVKSGDVVAEIESDKAIMELQTFKDGVVKELLLQEGEDAKVGNVIATIETSVSASASESISKQKEEPVAAAQELSHETLTKPAVTVAQATTKEISLGISPKARVKAAEYGFDMKDMIDKSKKNMIHAEDVQRYVQERYFTPKALKLLQQYKLEASLFELNHKVDEYEVQTYIDTHEILLPKELSSMQKAIAVNVMASAKKPVFHIYDSLDATLFEAHTQRSITVWLLKIFAKVMMRHEVFRSVIYDDTITMFPNASISLAVGDKKDLYMPVVKDVNKLKAGDIAKRLEDFKVKLQKRSFSSDEMQGGSFAISNLGMLGIERFDAMINKNESAIVAVGAIKEGKIAITLTADHRVINGYEAALFVKEVKKEAQNSLNFKD